MARVGMGILVAAALTLTGSTPAAAQDVGGDGWWSPLVLQQEGGTGSVIRDAVLGGPSSGREARGRGRGNARNDVRGARNGNGPPFCRNGQGHPVHGWRWCEEKGWAGTSVWQRAGWGDVIIRGPAPSRERRVREPTLGDILGDVVLGRVTRLGRDGGLSGALDGRWLPLSSGGAVLQLRMGGVPLAELADLNRDGRADVVLVNQRR